MQLRPEEPIKSLWPEPGRASRHGPHPLGPGGPTTISHFQHNGSVLWRYGDEPGHWRDAKGRLLPIEMVKHALPQLAEELEQRAMAEDKAKVYDEVERLVRGGATRVVEQRGSYELVDLHSGGLFEIRRSGISIHGTALPEPMARRILDTLAPEPVTLEPTTTIGSTS